MRFDSPIEATSLFLARNFAKENQVYYIEYPLTITDYRRNKNAPEFLTMKNSFSNAADALLETHIPNLTEADTAHCCPNEFFARGACIQDALENK